MTVISHLNYLGILKIYHFLNFLHNFFLWQNCSSNQRSAALWNQCNSPHRACVWWSFTSTNRCEWLLFVFFSVHLNIKECFYLFNTCGGIAFNWIFSQLSRLPLELFLLCVMRGFFFCFVSFPFSFHCPSSVIENFVAIIPTASCLRVRCAMCTVFNPIIAIKWKHNILFCSINHRKEEN